MRAHVKKGYTHSGVLDIARSRYRKPVFRAGVIRNLTVASEYRLKLMNVELSELGTLVEYRKDGTRCITDMSPESVKFYARFYINRAREWRQEFAR